MGSHQVEWKKSALRELKRLDRQVVPRILAAVDSLSTQPQPAGVRKLQGSQRTYRIRVDTYRVIYELNSAVGRKPLDGPINILYASVQTGGRS